MANSPRLSNEFWKFWTGQTISNLGTSFTQFAIPSLVPSEGEAIVTANGRIQASYSAAAVVGPLLAGALVAFISIPLLLVVDAASFLVSALSLAIIRLSFNLNEPRAKTSIRQDVIEGLRYVLSHPVLRNISAMMALVNLVG